MTSQSTPLNHAFCTVTGRRFTGYVNAGGSFVLMYWLSIYAYYHIARLNLDLC